MDYFKVLCSVAVNVMALFVTSTYGSNLQGALATPFHSSGSPLVRVPRSVSDGSLASCAGLRTCYVDSDLALISQFQYAEFTRGLVERCANMDASTCQDGDCEGHAGTTLAMYRDILEWICDHKEDLQTNAACWADPFEERMNHCTDLFKNTMTYDNDVRTGFSHVQACAEVALREIPGCTEQGQDFFQELYGYLAEQVVEMLGEVYDNDTK